MRQQVITAADLSRADVNRVLDRAAEIADDPGAVADRLAGEVVALCFFEPSTRTRMSFETATHRLGGDVVDMGTPEESSVAKGESLADTVRVVDGYADAIVLRHPREGAATLAAEFVDAPLVNAGDGAGHHPTQTLLDLYTMRSTVGLDGVTVGIMGDLKYGRTVHSLATALTAFDVDQHFVSPESLQLPPGVRLDLHDAGATVRIQRERFPDESAYREVAGQYRIDAATLEAAREDMVVMHPLPRIDEIAPDVDDTDHAVYFRQAHSGVPVRMALLDLMLGDDQGGEPE
ncbi:aspartate carbamoyltransferase [Halobacteriales archaeon SW_7_71_33]|nr:MAG: aspartate carbamoyltransferase [Halobacteriales archaeon SW_7_71_33]